MINNKTLQHNKVKILPTTYKKIFSKWIKLCVKHKPVPPFEVRQIKKVLVYGYTGLGNFIMYTPALRILKHSLPGADFTLLHGNDSSCHEVVSGGHIFNQFLVIKRKGDRWTKIKWLCKIRRANYDLIVSEFHNNNPFMALLTLLSGAKYKVGHVSSPGWKNGWDFIYNIPVQMRKNQHEIDRYLELAYVLGASREQIDTHPFVYIDSDDRKFAESFLISHGIESKNKIIGVSVGTGPAQRWKQWDIEKYKILCEKLIDLPHVKIILMGSPIEVQMIEDLAGRMKQKPTIAVGKTTIKQMAALIERLNLLICNDSGSMHVAVAVDTPVIAIYGPTDYTRTAPRGKKHLVIRKNLECSPCFRMNGKEKVKNCSFEYQCLNLISVDELLKAAREKIYG